MFKGKVTLYPTPLGNISDPIYKFYKDEYQLKESDIYVVESLKNFKTFMKNVYGDIKIDENKIYILNKNSRKRDINEIIDQLHMHKVALLSDAGTPTISDPGRYIVRAAHKQNLEVEIAIATSSIIASLACSGLNGENFEYVGYLPIDKKERISKIQELVDSSAEKKQTKIMIETPYRNIHLWKDLMNFLPHYADLSISVDIYGDNSIIKTASVDDWNKMKWPLLKDRNAVFLFSTNPR